MATVSELVSKRIGNTITNSQTWGGVMKNVASFDAVGDGVTDDTAEIQAAIDAAIADGGKAVFFPHGSTGVYKVTSLSNLSSVVLFGDNASFSGITNNIYQLGIDPSQSTYAADAGSTDTYAVTLDPVPAAYFTGMVVRFKANTLNTGAATLNVNALGAKTIKKSYNSDLGTGDILANQIVEVVYDGTNFQLLSVPSNLANMTQEAWIAPTLQNSWVDDTTPSGYMKDTIGFVHLKGTIKSGTATVGTVLFNLPAGYRPASDLPISTISNNGSVVIVTHLNVDAAGNVTIHVGANTWLSLNVPPFRGEL